jgi:hexosaminidase
MGYRYTILTNRPASRPTGIPRCFEADIAIAVPGDAPSLPVEIRYSLVNPVLKVESDLFDNRTINGDLNVLT